MGGWEAGAVETEEHRLGGGGDKGKENGRI